MKRTLQLALFVCLLGVFASPAMAQDRPPSKRLPPPKGAVPPPQQQRFPQMRRPGRGPMGDRGQNGPAMDPRGPHVGAWLERHHNQSPEQQEESLRRDPNFQNLPPEAQARLLRRLKHFNSLSPDEQQRMIERMHKFERLSPEQRDQLRRLQDGMHDLPDDRRQALRQTIHELRDMSPQDRQKFLQSDRFRNSFNEQEQGLIRGWNDLDTAAEEQPANQDPPDGPNDGPNLPL